MTKLLTATQQKNLDKLLELRYQNALEEFGYYIDSYYRNQRTVRPGGAGHAGQIVKDLYAEADKKVEDEFANKHPDVKDVQKKVNAWIKRTNEAYEKIREEASAKNLHLPQNTVGNSQGFLTVGQSEMAADKRAAQQKVAEKVQEAVNQLHVLYAKAQEKILLATLSDVENVDDFFGFPTTEELLA